MPPYVETPAHSPLEEFYITMPGLPSHTEVMQTAPVNSPSFNGERQTDPLWAVVCVCAGAALSVASGVFLIAMEVLK